MNDDIAAELLPPFMTKLLLFDEEALWLLPVPRSREKVLLNDSELVLLLTADDCNTASRVGSELNCRFMDEFLMCMIEGGDEDGDFVVRDVF
jgi:hypothetical protein